MEKNQTDGEAQATTEQNVSTTVDSAIALYKGASNLVLTPEEQQKLQAPFEELEFEIRPDGFIYLPQALFRKRLNDVLGIGQWFVERVNVTIKEVPGKSSIKIFYDGVMLIRNKAVSHSTGEATYNSDNPNQSEASAVEAAKSDCTVRCCKDLGIASEMWQPAYIRQWQKKHAIRVYVRNEVKNKTEVVWRRKDLEPFWNEAGVVDPTFKTKRETETGEKTTVSSTTLPWLNEGKDFDTAVSQLIAGSATVTKLKESFRISRKTEEELYKAFFTAKADKCIDMKALTTLYNENSAVVESYVSVKNIFHERRSKINLKVA